MAQLLRDRYTKRYGKASNDSKGFLQIIGYVMQKKACTNAGMRGVNVLSLKWRTREMLRPIVGDSDSTNR